MDQRKRKWLSIRSVMAVGIAVFCAVIVGIAALPEAAFASSGPIWVSIPVQVQTTGNVPSGMTYQIELARKTQGAPMPERAEGADRFVLTANAGEAAWFERLAYSVPGDYEYQITQTTQDRSNFTFDRSVYRVTVHIFNGTDGGFESGLSVEKDGEDGQTKPGAKAEAILFANRYSRSSGGGGHSGGGSSGGSSSSSSGGSSTSTSETAASEPAQTFPDVLFPEPGPVLPGPLRLPKTGDLTHEWFWAILAGISGAVGIGLIVKNLLSVTLRENGNENENLAGRSRRKRGRRSGRVQITGNR